MPSQEPPQPVALAGQFHEGEYGEVVFTDLSRAYFRKYFAKHGFVLENFPAFDEFAVVARQIGYGKMDRALARLSKDPIWQQLPDCVTSLKQ